MGPYCRLAFVITDDEIPASGADPGSALCKSALCDFLEFRATANEGELLLSQVTKGKRPRVYNTWPKKIPSQTRLLIGQLPDGRWVPVAEAC